MILRFIIVLGIFWFPCQIHVSPIFYLDLCPQTHVYGPRVQAVCCLPASCVATALRHLLSPLIIAASLHPLPRFAERKLSLREGKDFVQGHTAWNGEVGI